MDARPVTIADFPTERSRERAMERDRRSRERADAALVRTEARAVEREQAARLREEQRDARRLEEIGRTQARTVERDEHDATTPDAPKRRQSGALRRTGEVQRERDTRGYQTIVDTGRMLELARRGASITGLAGAFGIPVDAVEALLAEAARDADDTAS